MKIAIVIILLCYVMICTVEAGEIGFIEDFALAQNREDALKQLIPGTEDYYFFHCLHAQNSGKLGAVESWINLWIKRHGYTDRVQEILNRQALLEYKHHPEKSLQYIKTQLSLRFDHQKKEPDRAAKLLSSLDPTQLDTRRLMKKALKQYEDLSGFEAAGLEMLQPTDLTPEQRRDLLKRLDLPDRPDLAQLVIADLKAAHSRGFGSHPIHKEMTRDQLDACARLMPDLVHQEIFVHTYLTKLAPSDDIDMGSDPTQQRAFLDRMWAFVSKLPASYNSLKAHILYHILKSDQAKGTYDRNLFMTYIQLPRNIEYMKRKYLYSHIDQHQQADLRKDYFEFTRMPAVVSDEALVRDYLSHFFQNGDDYKPYAKYLQDEWLKHLFAETKIIHGQGDMEQWAAMMDPSQYQQLALRVDLELLPTNKTFFSTQDPVSLELAVKNVETLIIKIFEINTFNYYQKYLIPVSTNISLDGLVATWEQVIHYQDGPFHQVRRTFQFPQIDKPGVYVVEFIGNGKSSRAVIRKGQLRFITRIGAAGHEFIIMDETNQVLPKATIWMAGRQFHPDTHGVITIPFTETPGHQTIILRHGDFCSLAEFNHLAETYHLDMGLYVDRESLIRGHQAKAIVRPMLTINGYPLDISLLKDPQMRVRFTDTRDITTSKVFKTEQLDPNRDWVIGFQVPDNLVRISFELTGTITPMAKPKEKTLSAQAHYELNLMDTTMAMAGFFPVWSNGQYELDVLGKNGEPQKNLPVHLTFKHRWFTQTIHASLKTDANGRIHLGNLDEMEWIQVKADGIPDKKWYPEVARHHYPDVIHGTTDNPIRVPFADALNRPDRLRVALMETRGNTIVADRFDAVSFQDGYLKIQGLDPGNYQLTLKTCGTRIRIKITNGMDHGDVVVSGNRILEKTEYTGIHISDIRMDGAALEFRVFPVTEATRIHVVARRFVPDFDGFDDLSQKAFPSPYEMRLSRPESLYESGRNIGDEYRYILERKYTTKYPGNMLPRPELLLNPWDVRKTETATDRARTGGAYAGRGAELDQAMKKPRPSASRPSRVQHRSDVNMDFLAQPAVVVANLVPDAQGRVRIDRDRLGSHSHMTIFAVDQLDTVCRSLSVTAPSLESRDLRMVRRLDPSAHFAEQNRITQLVPDMPFHINDITTAKLAVYDSLPQVYGLLMAMSGDTTLNTFQFITQWPDLTETEKQTFYGKYVCHELNFFIYHKDKVFFDSVVTPHLKNKADKTFMDHWLLGNDLSDYTDSKRFSRLNVVEKILLLRRMDPSLETVTRYVKELTDLIPPNPETFNRLLDTSLKHSATEGDRFDLGKVREAALAEPKPVEEAPSPELALEDREMPPPSPQMARMEAMAAPPKEALAGTVGKKSLFRHRKKSKADIQRRQSIRQFYQKTDTTMEWAETNYYRLPIESQTPDRIQPNPFWQDYASTKTDSPFISGNFIYATSNFTEMMLALAVLDIPFHAQPHPTQMDGIRFQLTPKSPGIVFHKEILPCPDALETVPIMVSQKYFQQNDRYRYVDNERVDHFVDDEFIQRKAYGCQVVVSNPSSARLRIQLLVQIPGGAVPLNNGFYTESFPMILDPYGIQTLEYAFYFPETGDFDGYPLQVSKNGQFLASAPVSQFHVVATASRTDTESWQYVSQNGSDQQVLDYLRTHNLHRINLADMAFRMKSKSFFLDTIQLLRNRHVFHDVLWSYGLYHNVPDIIAEYLPHTRFADQCGMAIQSPLLTIDPVVQRLYQHLEYKPLINARTHQLGKQRKILNHRFFQQYEQFMRKLAYQPALDAKDHMALVVYLLTQDRIEEALEWFSRIDAEDLPYRIQYDYLKVYMAFYRGDIDTARQIAKAYGQYPVPRWQQRFRTALAQLDELTGRTSELVETTDTGQRMEHLAATEPSLDLSVEGRKLHLTYRNINQCRINYYPMDIEFLFSRNPFFQKETGHFAFIRPQSSQTIDLPSDPSGIDIELPDAYRNSNLMVEAVAQGIKQTRAFYANSMNVQIMDNYGRLKLTRMDTNQPLPGTYVKVYARMNDQSIRFYKDGYTDLRGWFDYASLSTDEIDRVSRFALLILSEDSGAVIREVQPPKR